MPLPLLAALAPTIAGGLMSLLGIGKGKEIPKESAATSAWRETMQSYLWQGLQRGNTPFMGTMPGSRSGVINDALNMIYRKYSKGKQGYTAPRAQGMQSILGLTGTSGYNPYASGYGGYRGGTGGYSPMGMPTGGYRGGMGGMSPMMGMAPMGGFSMNPWARQGGAGQLYGSGMPYRPLD